MAKKLVITGREQPGSKKCQRKENKLNRGRRRPAPGQPTQT